MDSMAENKMGIQPVNKLLLSMSLPMMISMLVQAAYNIVDSLFVAQISENALTAVSLAFPIQNLIIAVASGTGVGINAVLSKSLGEKNFTRVNKAATNGVFLAVISAIVFLIFGILGSRWFFEIQTGDQEIVEYGYQYLSICSIFSFGCIGQITYEKLLQSTGKTMYTMITQGTGAIINIILDPILIFGWLGLPKMGVAGAAIATVTGQIIAMIMAIILNHKYNHEVKMQWRKFRPEGRAIRRIYQVGAPSIIMMAISSIMTFGMNKILMVFSSTATAVFGVYFKLQSFVFMPVFGLNNGMVPIVAYNYGARKKKRIEKTIQLSVIYAVAIMLVGLIVLQLIPGPILSLFNASTDMMSIGIVALRIISLSFIFAGFCVIISSVFQALGHGLLSLIVSVGRQLVVLLPVAYIFSVTMGLDAVWWSYPIAEVVSVILCVIFMRYVHKRDIAPIEEPKESI